MANEAWKEGDDVLVEMTYERLPEIPEVDYKKVKLEKLVVKADEKSVEEALTSLAGTAQSFDDRKKGSKAKSGDQVVIDFLGKLGGEPFEGGAAEDYPLVLGSNSFIPGFEDQLVGVKAGEEKVVTVTFPAEYGAKHLAGQEATFDVTVKAVKEPKPAEINDELAKRFGAESLDALKAQITERLEAEYTGAARQVMKRALLDQLDGMVELRAAPEPREGRSRPDRPPALARGTPRPPRARPRPCGADGRAPEARRAPRAPWAPAGRAWPEERDHRVGRRDDAGRAHAGAPVSGQERQFFEFVQKNPQMRQQIQAPIFEDKVVDYVFEQAQVKEKAVSKDALQKAVEKLEEA